MKALSSERRGKSIENALKLLKSEHVRYVFGLSQDGTKAIGQILRYLPTTAHKHLTYSSL